MMGMHLMRNIQNVFSILTGKFLVNVLLVEHNLNQNEYQSLIPTLSTDQFLPVRVYEYDAKA